MSARILIAVTHLLGSGHLVRARHLAQALAEAGHQVMLASGGMPLRAASEGAYSFTQLPPIRIEGVDFGNLLDEGGQPIDAACHITRQAMLTELAMQLAPDIVITEHFPFGRRKLAAGYLGLIAAAKAANPAALVLSSIRDVLVTPRADRIEEAHRRIAAHFDGVLVHGDRAFLPLEASWPVTRELSARLHYAGYLTGPPLRADRSAPGDAQRDGGSRRSVRNDGEGDILVSGGGSGAALPLFRLCLDAASLLGSSRRWRILVGRGLGQAAFDDLQAAAPPHVTVEWARLDFPELLSACALSISQAGYNTVLDLVAAGRPAIVVPFDAGGETEQTIRAEAMQRAGLARCLRLAGPEPLTAGLLAQTAAAALRGGAPRPAAIDRDGASGAVAAITRLLAERAGTRG